MYMGSFNQKYLQLVPHQWRQKCHLIVATESDELVKNRNLYRFGSNFYTAYVFRRAMPASASETFWDWPKSAFEVDWPEPFLMRRLMAVTTEVESRFSTFELVFRLSSVVIPYQYQPLRE